MYLNDSKKGYKKNQVFLPFHLENHINHLQIFKSVYTLGVILFSPRRSLNDFKKDYKKNHVCLLFHHIQLLKSI